jgi:hypothetical protein
VTETSQARATGPTATPFLWLKRQRWTLVSKAKRHILLLLTRMLPYSFSGDRAFSYIHFVFKQGRLPQQRMLFHDYLFRMKMSGELLSLPRQLVSDKELCKIYVDHRIGPGRTIPTLAILRRKEEVTEDAFPDRCVIKPTHTSGSVVMRKAGESLDLAEIRSFFDGSLYRFAREQNYKFLEPKVIVEPIVFDGVMIEMKIHCYRGQARIFSVHPMEDKTLERFDRDWNRLNVRQRKPFPAVPTPRPDCLDEITQAAERLSGEFDYMRVDMYVSGKDWIVGELTNCHLNINSRFLDIDEEKVFSRALFGDQAA